jgi:hypothetical protein
VPQKTIAAALSDFIFVSSNWNLVPDGLAEGRCGPQSASCSPVSASGGCVRWRRLLLGRGIVGIGTQGGVVARKTRFDLPWAMVFSPCGAFVEQVDGSVCGRWSLEGGSLVAEATSPSLGGSGLLGEESLAA